MAQQIIDLGTGPNTGSGEGIRIGGIKINDNFTELYNRVQALESGGTTPEGIMRTKLSESCNGGTGQVISFSSQFSSVYALEIIDFAGNGVEVTAQDQDGFTINSFTAGTFGYIALIEV